MIAYCIISGFLNAATSFALGFAVLFRRLAGRLNVPFFAFAMLVSVWSMFYVLSHVAENAEDALFWSRSLSVVAILVPAAYFHFGERLIGSTKNGLIIIVYAGAAVLAVLSPTSWMVESVGPIGSFKFWPHAGVLYPVWVSFFGGITTLNWHRMGRAMRDATGARRNQLKFVLGGTLLGFAGGMTNLPLWFGLDVPPIGNGLVMVYVFGVAYAIVRFRLLEINYVVIKGAVYAVTAAPLAAIFLAAVLLPQRLFGDSPHSLVFWSAVSAGMAFVSLLVIPKLKNQLDDLLEQTLLKSYVEGRDRMRDLAAEFSAIRDEAGMYERTVEGLSEALGATVALYMRGELETVFKLRAVRQTGAAINFPGEILDHHPMLNLVRTAQRSVLVEEVERIDEQAWAELSGLRSALQVEAVVPVQADVFHGLLLLGPRRSHRVYSDRELSGLDAVGLQLALHLHVRQVERRANQAEKLISLGTLAAGLAHEMRNPLVSIKTFAALLGENAGDPTLHREFSATVLRDVGRIESIVENVAAFATDRKVAFTWIRLEEVVRAAYEIARPSFVAAGVDFQFDSRETPLVRGNYNQLTQVLINLLNNAVQAIGARDGGKVVAALRHRADDDHNPSVEMAVSDNGPGVDPEVMVRMFEPFITTKATGDRERKGGMGLGLAIVKRIVDGHNGVIRVEATPGRGTTFTVVLPCEAPST